MKRSLAALVRPARILTALLLSTAAAVVLLPAPASAAAAEFRKDGQWSDGYVGRITVRNDEAATLPSWRVELQLPAGTVVSQSWAVQTVRTGDRYVFTPPAGRGALVPGAAFAFGFVTRGTGDPVSCSINGVPCTGVRPPARDIRPPTTPANLRAIHAPDTLTLAWDPATDDTGVTAYEVFANGNRMAVVNATSFTMPIPPPMVIAFGVRAVDAAGNASPFALYGPGFPVDTQPPTAPTGLQLNRSAGYFSVTWTASRDNVMVAGYRVYLNDVLLAEVGNTTAYARDPGGFGEWVFRVCAFDAAGNTSSCVRTGIAVDPPPPTRAPPVA